LLYLLDANTLIDAEQLYYGFDQVPEFWDWLLAEGAAGRVKMPSEIWQEIKGSRSDLGKWINKKATKDVLILDEQPDLGLVQHVLDRAYAPDLTDSEIEQIGADPFLAAYGLVSPDRVVVTKETSKTTQVRARRKLPDACVIVGVPWMTDFMLFRTLGFSTKKATGRR
jgi:uncharacterized protein DUF4411